jgi:hypothetical protein
LFRAFTRREIRLNSSHNRAGRFTHASSPNILIQLESEIARALKNSFSGNYLIVEEKFNEDSDSAEKDI